MVVIGSDCLKHTVPEPELVTVTDSDTVNLTLTGQNITADVIIDPDLSNALIATGDGLLVSCAEILVCAPPSPSWTPTPSTSRSSDRTCPRTWRSLRTTGTPSRYAPTPVRGRLLRLNDGDSPVPAVKELTVLVGADCNRYTIPGDQVLTVVDTSCLNLSVSGPYNHTLTGNVLIAPGQLIPVHRAGPVPDVRAGPGLRVDRHQQLLVYDDINNAVYFRASTDAGNQLGLAPTAIRSCRRRPSRSPTPTASTSATTRHRRADGQPDH
jgi:hypothetical protein